MNHHKPACTIHCCVICSAPAVWIRRTQFAGDHFFCLLHAKEEKDFKKSDSYAFWERA